MRIAVVPGLSGDGLLCELAADGGQLRDPVTVDDLSRAIAEREQSADASLRWVWSDTARVYPALLRAGVRVGRCHDLTLAGALLASSSAGGGGESGSLDRAAWELGTPGLAGRGIAGAGRPAQDVLFEPERRAPPDLRVQLDAVTAVHARQLRAIAADEHPGRFAALVAAESAGGLAAAEMSYAGIPWRADVHDELLSGMLGRRPPAHPPGTRPGRLAELAAQIVAAFSGRQVNPDSPAQLIKAFATDGVRVPSTRSSVLNGIDHPAVPLLLEYKELSRLHTAHGWSWLDTWVSGARFKPEYVVGGVVSGRWASRGGGALQIPRVLRKAVVADPGWVLVVADAAQLEPRVLAALAGDRAFTSAAAAGDLYEALASAFGGERAKAKIALLSAMYGGAAGEAAQLLAILRRRFPDAAGYVEAAARAGEEGKVVRSILGRTCPPPSAAWRAMTEESGDPDAERDPGAGRAARARGRFTRNFVVQASAADWALVLLAGLRSRLAALGAPAGPPQSAPPGSVPPGSVPPGSVPSGEAVRSASAQREPVRPAPAQGEPAQPAPVRPELEPLESAPWRSVSSVPAGPRDLAQAANWGPHLVFFQHDEVIVHCPEGLADAVVAAVKEAADAAGRLVFGVTEVRFPMTTAVVRCYADAK